MKKSIRANNADKCAMASRQRQAELCDSDKENRKREDTESTGGTVKRIRARYEELANSQQPVDHSVASKGPTGAIKKRIATDKLVEKNCETNIVIKTRVTVNETEVFAKSRFKVYADRGSKIGKELASRKLEETNAGNECGNRDQEAPKNRHLTRVRAQAERNRTVEQRFTPIDVPFVPLIPKKVKVQHRKSSKNTAGKLQDIGGSVCHRSEYRPPYEDDFISIEMQDEDTPARVSKGFREKNITIEQRKIIVKFLVRLHTHRFYPSSILYQTVKIFDAALDARRIQVEELQLTALAAMWIALKRNATVYSVPTADTMIAFSNDLYAGRTDLLLKCEINVLKSLNFEIAFPDPFSMLYYDISKSARADFIDNHQFEIAYYCGGYMIDLTLFDENLMNTRPSLIAASAAEAALHLTLEDLGNDSVPLFFLWRAPHTAKRYSETELASVRTRLIQKVSASRHRHNEGEIVFKKYSRSRYGKIAQYLGNKVKLFLE